MAPLRLRHLVRDSAEAIGNESLFFAPAVGELRELDAQLLETLFEDVVLRGLFLERFANGPLQIPLEVADVIRDANAGRSLLQRRRHFRRRVADDDKHDRYSQFLRRFRSIQVGDGGVGLVLGKDRLLELDDEHRATPAKDCVVHRLVADLMVENVRERARAQNTLHRLPHFGVRRCALADRAQRGFDRATLDQLLLRQRPIEHDPGRLEEAADVSTAHHEESAHPIACKGVQDSVSSTSPRHGSR